MLLEIKPSGCQKRSFTTCSSVTSGFVGGVHAEIDRNPHILLQHKERHDMLPGELQIEFLSRVNEKHGMTAELAKFIIGGSLLELYADDCLRLFVSKSIRAIKNIQNIEVLHVSATPGVDDDFVTDIAATFGTQLKELVVANCG
ncbi:hypothetical protein L1987_70243 [Smallanthus sonchifolius]|uniref:Uncharacterized protein n=1 Tax=Smallanthus sonchifolius TaxID=185202 RepID=A0ACB9APC0_9ASTR|nr:hypothetical protein L1987_70243 [Smallanthus sonchifolius]